MITLQRFWGLIPLSLCLSLGSSAALGGSVAHAASTPSDACAPGAIGIADETEISNPLTDALNPYLDEARKRYERVYAGKSETSVVVPDAGIVYGTAPEIAYLKTWLRSQRTATVDPIFGSHDARRVFVELMASCQPATVRCILEKNFARIFNPEAATESAYRVLENYGRTGIALLIPLESKNLAKHTPRSVDSLRRYDWSVAKLPDTPSFRAAARDLTIWFNVEISSEACGLYQPGLHYIEYAPKCDQPDTYVHEIFHALQFRTSFIEKNGVATSAWMLSKDGQEVVRRKGAHFPTFYSQTDPVENFAESGMIYTLDPSELKRVDESQFRFFRDEVFGGLVPKETYPVPGLKNAVELRAGTDQLTLGLALPIDHQSEFAASVGLSSRNFDEKPVLGGALTMYGKYKWGDDRSWLIESPERIARPDYSGIEARIKSEGRADLVSVAGTRTVFHQAAELSLGTALVSTKISKKQFERSLGLTGGIKMQGKGNQLRAAGFVGTHGSRLVSVAAEKQLSRRSSVYVESNFARGLRSTPYQYNLGLHFDRLGLPRLNPLHRD